tara:strand:- start:426 stop:608 length:183 start_codon:yes stop_codon:yes gene_type:complete
MLFCFGKESQMYEFNKIKIGENSGFQNPFDYFQTAISYNSNKKNTNCICTVGVFSRNNRI